jgi:hypothetical protein
MISRRNILEVGAGAAALGSTIEHRHLMDVDVGSPGASEIILNMEEESS